MNEIIVHRSESYKYFQISFETKIFMNKDNFGTSCSHRAINEKSVH